jgi:hypothetical protein
MSRAMHAIRLALGGKPLATAPRPGGGQLQYSFITKI